ncbi:unnamed protein product [Triticum turgidum subsp. durum]|uniref:Uncharacterized protein n=1 Tax=Triticum turgidum subsp. durum TaxID=4567 RepID=A0A9R0VVX1_TRITD|nr:unnamed protein product [Triticum turgidum subsp. durum]
MEPTPSELVREGALRRHSSAVEHFLCHASSPPSVAILASLCVVVSNPDIAHARENNRPENLPCYVAKQPGNIEQRKAKPPKPVASSYLQARETVLVEEGRRWRCEYARDGGGVNVAGAAIGARARLGLGLRLVRVMDLYVDYEKADEPMTFFHVFLYSQALECIVPSMAKRDELLQFAQCAISGLKINSEISRLDNEIMQLQQEINAIDAVRVNTTRNRNKASPRVPEDYKTAADEVRLCSRMEDLVLKKKSIHPGDSLETHFQKVDKLKVLSESLANSSAKAEKRIMENRLQREESLSFKITKTNEVSITEKELEGEISGLQKRRGQLEEDELSRSVASSKVEASTVRAWINFLEDTWKLQSLYEEIKEKQANDELDRCGVCFVNLIKHHVSACVDELNTSVDCIKTFVDNLKIFSDSCVDRSVSTDDGGLSKQSNPRKYLEEEYLETEKKVVTAFSLADNIRALTFSNPERKTRLDDPEVKNLFASIDRLRVEFESVPRPVLQIEINEKEEGSRRTRSPSSKGGGGGTPTHSRTESPIAAQLRTRLPSESDSEPGKFDQDYREYGADDIGGWEFDDLEGELRSGF